MAYLLPSFASTSYRELSTTAEVFFFTKVLQYDVEKSQAKDKKNLLKMLEKQVNKNKKYKQIKSRG